MFCIMITVKCKCFIQFDLETRSLTASGTPDTQTGSEIFNCLRRPNDTEGYLYSRRKKSNRNIKQVFYSFRNFYYRFYYPTLFPSNIFAVIKIFVLFV